MHHSAKSTTTQYVMQVRVKMVAHAIRMLLPEVTLVLVHLVIVDRNVLQVSVSRFKQLF
jgi:hypothetical protein